MQQWLRKVRGDLLWGWAAATLQELSWTSAGTAALHGGTLRRGKMKCFSNRESALTCEKAFPFLHMKKPTKNPSQTMLPFLMQLVSSWPKCVLGEKCLCLAETQPGCGARWLDARGRWVLFAVAKSTICLLAVFPKAVWQAVWEENIQKNKVSAENCKHVSWHSSALVYQCPSPVLHLIQHRVFVAAGNFIENHQ